MIGSTHMEASNFIPSLAPWKEIQLSSFHGLISSRPKPHWLVQIQEQIGGYAFGGYLENRGPFFDSRHVGEYVIHLGVDFWAPEGTPIYCPFPGKILSATPTSDTHGGWGARIDVLIGTKVLIFGHLNSNNLPRPGTLIDPGVIGTLASRSHNGGWQPHLHLQGASLEEYSKYSNPRDMDAYAPFSTDLITRYPNPLTYAHPASKV